MKKEINKDCSISFEIRVCEVSDEDKSRSYKSKNKMVINDVEYNFIKKCLNNEYGIGDHFEDLDREVEEIIKKGVKNQKWFQDNFVRAWERNINDYNNARQAITSDYMALRKNNKDVE